MNKTAAMHSVLLLQLVILLQICCSSEMSFRYEVRPGLLERNGMRPRKREARLYRNPLQYSEQYQRYLDEFNRITQQKQYNHHQSPVVPNFQVRKISETPDSYGYKVNRLTVTPPSSVILPQSPTPHSLNIQRESPMEYPKFLNIPPPMPHPRFFNIPNSRTAFPTQAPYHPSKQQRHQEVNGLSQAPHHPLYYPTPMNTQSVSNSPLVNPITYPSTPTT